MLSVIVPTMWAYSPFIDFLKTIVDIEYIGEFILINNSKQNTPVDDILNHPKIRVISPDSNLYVAPSWNLGAHIAQFETLGFLSDDVFVDNRVFEKVDAFFNKDINDEVGMIGILSKYLEDPNYDMFYTNGNIDIVYVHDNTLDRRPSATGMGNLFFVKKKDWKDIPHVKIFHGEVLQWKRLDLIKKNYVITNCYNDTPWHATWHMLSDVSSDEFGEIQKNDQNFMDNVGYFE